MIPPQETVLQRPYQCDRRRPSRASWGAGGAASGTRGRVRSLQGGGVAWPGAGLVGGAWAVGGAWRPADSLTVAVRFV